MGSRERVVIMAKFMVGDRVRLRKGHPCGSSDWEIMRTGMDFRIKCLGCGHQVMLPRIKFEKSVKAVIFRMGETEEAKETEDKKPGHQ